AAVATAAHAERTKNPEVRKMWAALADRFAVNFEALCKHTRIGGTLVLA
ncbi:MAG: DUF3693 domain-containing protein, partial [Cupriavidus necator]